MEINVTTRILPKPCGTGLVCANNEFYVHYNVRTVNVNMIYALGISLNALMAFNSSTDANVLDADFEIPSLASLPKGSNSGNTLPTATPDEVTTS